MIDLKTLIERIATLDAVRYPVAHVIAWAERRAREAQKNATP